ncbi:MAG: choline kinase [Alphaproteobacteria bacterium]|jgi:choline kinase
MDDINKPSLKAIILAAGVGSRIKPLTDSCPKSLLTVAGMSILERMIGNIQACGINEIILVLGYLNQQIEELVTKKFPDIEATFIFNEKFEETNTGYSLMLTEAAVNGTGFVKFDADVVFEIEILRKLIASPLENCLCIDRDIQLDAEEVKVLEGENNRVLQASKTVDPSEAVGESIGVEKINSDTARLLFEELGLMMRETTNYQTYYEAAYERLISNDVPFHTVDITGLNWTEIDTHEDFRTANEMFAP